MASPIEIFENCRERTMELSFLYFWQIPERSGGNEERRRGPEGRIYIRASHYSAAVTARCSPKELIKGSLVVFWTPHRSQSLSYLQLFIYSETSSATNTF